MIRILLIVPAPGRGSALQHTFELEEDLSIEDVITSESELPANCEHIDVIGLCAQTPFNDLLWTVRQIHGHAPKSRLVLLFAPEIHDVLLSAIEMGVCGIVEQGKTAAEMFQIIRAVHTYGAASSPEFARILVKRVTDLHREVALHNPAALTRADKLSDRQWAVLGLVSQGLSNAEIADRLFITTGTVKNHIHTILSKLGADNREHASTWYSWQQQAREASLDIDGS